MDILDKFYNEFDEIDFEKLFMFLDDGCIGCEQKEKCDKWKCNAFITAYEYDEFLLDDDILKN